MNQTGAGEPRLILRAPPGGGKRCYSSGRNRTRGNRRLPRAEVERSPLHVSVYVPHNVHTVDAFPSPDAFWKWPNLVTRGK